jgi:hypothetical protein
LQNFVEAAVDAQFLFHDGDQHVDADAIQIWVFTALSVLP